jgi:hypothetical protein
MFFFQANALMSLSWFTLPSWSPRGQTHGVRPILWLMINFRLVDFLTKKGVGPHNVYANAAERQLFVYMLPVDILRQHIAPCLVSFADIKRARLVCKSWSAAILLPGLYISSYNLDEINDIKCSKKVSIANIPELEKILQLAALLADSRSVVSSIELFTGEDDTIASLLRVIMSNNYVLNHLSLAFTKAATKSFEVLASWPESTPNLVSLDFSGTYFKGEDVGLIARALEQPQCSLQTFRAINNSIGDSASLLADSLIKNTKLTEIVLKKVNAGDKLAESFAQLLTQNSTLQILDLRENEFTAAGCAVLFGALKVNRGLQTLLIECRGAGSMDAVGPLTEALRLNTTLTDLSLNQCKIHDFAQREFFNAVKDSSTLRSLSLTHTFMNLVETFDFVRFNTSLHTLNLYHCFIGTRGPLLASALRANQTLRELNAALNNFPAATASDFVEAIKDCKSLRKIYLHLNPSFGPEAQALLKEAAQERTVPVSCHL